MYYPINFVVKHPNLVSLSAKPALRRWETCRKLPACLLIGATQNKMAPIGKQRMRDGGADRDRTGDLMLAKHALSQLSYSPIYPPQKVKIAFRGPRGACAEMVGLGRVELPTSPLSGVRSNQLSYRPSLAKPAGRSPAGS